jgi:hypothetical protein
MASADDTGVMLKEPDLHDPIPGAGRRDHGKYTCKYMSQVSLYLEPKVHAKVKAAAKAAGLSVSAWVARAIQANIANEWPPQLDELIGSWRDFPFERPTFGKDVPREPL